MLNEGEVQPGEIQEGAVTGASPTPAETQNPSNSPAPGANTGMESVPFHENPQFKSFLDRQKKNWERDSERKYSEQTEKLKSDYDNRFKTLEQKMSQSGSGMSEENRTQLRALSQLLSSDPEARKMLGLEDMNELKEKLSRYEQGSTMTQFNSELSDVSKSYAEKYGFDVKEVEADLLDFIKDDPLWGQMGNAKGVIRKAAKDYFSDKSEELAERAANMKLVKESTNKAKVLSQKPSGGNAQTLPEPKNFRDAVRQATAKIEREGVKI